MFQHCVVLKIIFGNHPVKYHLYEILMNFNKDVTAVCG